MILKMLRTALALTAVLLASAAAPAAAISLKDEEKLSREFMRMARKHFEFITETAVADYVSEVGQRIAANLPPQPFSFHFHVIREPVYNAFATPAGHVFIHSGLLAVMEDEGELAGILSHEIAHQVCRHISQKIERQKKLNLATLAGVVAGAFLGAGGAGSAAGATAMGSVAATQAATLAFSRQDEMQADQLAVQYLKQTGYDAAGLLTVLEKIRAKQWFGSGQVPSYLNTHPAVEQRLAYIGGVVASGQGTPAEPLAVDARGMSKARAVLLGRYTDPEVARNVLASRLQDAPSDPWNHYGMGLLLDRTGRRDQALGHLRQALAAMPLDPDLLRDVGRVYSARGEYTRALEVLHSANDLQGLNPDTLTALGETYLALEDYAAAVPWLEKAATLFPARLEALYSLAQALGRSGRVAEAHFHLGRYHHRQHDVKNARFHLQRALEGLTDPRQVKQARGLLAKVEDGSDAGDGD